VEVHSITEGIREVARELTAAVQLYIEAGNRADDDRQELCLKKIH
jgi:hypothetical protein